MKILILEKLLYFIKIALKTLYGLLVKNATSDSIWKVLNYSQTIMNSSLFYNNTNLLHLYPERLRKALTHDYLYIGGN